LTVARPQAGRPPAKKPRQRAGIRKRSRRPIGLRRPWLLLLIVFGLACLGVLAVGLTALSLTILSVGRVAPAQKLPASTHSPSQTAVSNLVGRPIDGTLVAVSAATNVVAIQPNTGNPVQATVNASSKITRAGVTATLASLIPGEAVVVTFSQTSNGALLVTQLQDIVSLPTNTPTPTPTQYPYFQPSLGGSNPVPSPPSRGPRGKASPAVTAP
jgi:hypothetical protein